MKIFTVFLLLFTALSFSSSIVVNGDVSGTWDADTVLVYGDITVPEGQELRIEPGTYIEFQSSYIFWVYGSLKAIGTENDSITFYSGDQDNKWQGIKYPNDPLERDSSIYDYCIFIGSNSSDSGIYREGAVFNVFNTPKFRLSNSRISDNESSVRSVVYLQEGSAGFITNNVIAYNNTSFHALFIGEYCDFTVMNNKICNNVGGGIAVIENSTALVINNLITNNFADAGGGVIVIDGSTSQFINNTICQNRATYAGGIFFTGPFSCQIVNCIITGNGCQLAGPQVILEDPMADPYFINCNIQGGPDGFDGDGAGANYDLFLYYRDNIDENPSFVDPEPSGHINGKGLRGDWSLLPESQCIDAGEDGSGGYPLPVCDIDGNQRIIGEYIDMGAYEWQGSSIDEDCQMIYSCADIKLSNHPNPFNPTTSISFELKKRETLSLEIFNIRGQLVRTLTEKEQFAAGNHSLIWDGKDSLGNEASSGIYFYRLQSGEDAVTKKMILLK